MKRCFVLSALVISILFFTRCTTDPYDAAPISLPVAASALEPRSSGGACAADGLIGQNIIACGLSRDYYIQLPVGFHIDSSYPLLFAFHGRGSGSDKACAWKDRIGAWIDEHQYIGVYPRAYQDEYWYVGDPMPFDPIADVCFIDKIKDQMIDHYSINTSRIYAMGSSNGGGLALHLARSVDWLAAITTLAATTWEGYDLASVPVLPLMHIHGDLDGTIEYNGGYSPGIGLTFHAARAADSIWAVDNNACPIIPKNQTIAVGAQIIYKTSWPKKFGLPMVGLSITKKEVIHYRLHGIHHTIYGEISPETKEKMNDDLFSFFGRHVL